MLLLLQPKLLWMVLRSVEPRPGLVLLLHEQQLMQREVLRREVRRSAGPCPGLVLLLHEQQVLLVHEQQAESMLVVVVCSHVQVVCSHVQQHLQQHLLHSC